MNAPPPPVSSAAFRLDLRRELRHRRRTLPACERIQMARALSSRIRRTPIYRASRRIGAYWAMDGEMDPADLIRHGLQHRKAIFLPVVQPNGRLLFGRFESGTRLAPNRFGIPEPNLARQQLISPMRLDLVLAPLVAFDARGIRLGMGGGFYDRTFAFLHRRGHWRRPVLMGLAYEFQRVDEVGAHPWDVPLHAVATEVGLYRF